VSRFWTREAKKARNVPWKWSDNKRKKRKRDFVFRFSNQTVEKPKKKKKRCCLVGCLTTYSESGLTGLSETGVVHALDAAHISGKGFIQRHQSQLDSKKKKWEKIELNENQTTK
jgi:hypothetical protein